MTPRLRGPTTTVILSRYTLSHFVFQHFEGCRRRIALHPPQKGPVAPTFSGLKRGVALQAASWKVSRYRGVSQLHCRLSRCSGALSPQLSDGMSSPKTSSLGSLGFGFIPDQLGAAGLPNKQSLEARSHPKGAVADLLHLLAHSLRPELHPPPQVGPPSPSLPTRITAQLILGGGGDLDLYRYFQRIAWRALLE